MTIVSGVASLGGLDERRAVATDLALVPLFDGRRAGLVNTWGGAWSVGNLQDASVKLCTMATGQRALRLALGNVRPGENRYLQCFASGFGPSREYYQTRDLTSYARLDFHLRNETRVPLRGILQLKDFRDSLAHSATFPFALGSAEAWSDLSIPLTLGEAKWQVVGHPDLTRILSLDFRFAPQTAPPTGPIYLTDVVLAERAGPLEVETSPLPVLIERLARRQWSALWSARSRVHGMIPNNSYQSTDAGLNTTAAMLWMLPSAVRRHWVAQDEADRYVMQLTATIDHLTAAAAHLPPRNVDWVTLKPSLLPEESVVDAAFLELALHRYQTLPTTPAKLQAALFRTQSRFDFASFACPLGWRMAYRYPTSNCPGGFTPCTYDGYTNEANLASLAAQLTPGRAVPIEEHWNSSTNRIRAGLNSGDGGPMVHSLPEFRAPFAQALWNLFVDVRQRGVDMYPDGRLAVNPWQNFVCYEQNVMTRLAQLGRTYLVQPDAGDDGTLGCYRQFSVYENFGQGDLFMPWSAAFALWSGAERGEESLRFLLAHQLHDPFGLADSAKWATAAAEPYSVAARHDFWNTSLATMALLECLDQQASASRQFAALPEIRTALDRVFPAETKAVPASRRVGKEAAGQQGRTRT